MTPIRNDGKINLSIRAAKTGEMPPPPAPRDRGPRRDGDRGPRRDFNDRGPRREFGGDHDRGPAAEGAPQPDRADARGPRFGGEREPAPTDFTGRPRDSVRRDTPQ